MNQTVFLHRTTQWIRLTVLAAIVYSMQSCSKAPENETVKPLLLPNDVVRPLTEGETALLEPVSRFYPEFSFPLMAWVDADTLPVRLLCPRPPVTFGTVHSWDVKLLRNQPFIFYEFTASHGERGKGLFMVTTEHVTRTETYCTPEKCISNFWGDGQMWDTREEENYGSKYRALEEQTPEIMGEDVAVFARLAEGRE